MHDFNGLNARIDTAEMLDLGARFQGGR